jgi:hypothetical protein
MIQQDLGCGVLEEDRDVVLQLPDLYDPADLHIPDAPGLRVLLSHVA